MLLENTRQFFTVPKGEVLELKSRSPFFVNVGVRKIDFLYEGELEAFDVDTQILITAGSFPVFVRFKRQEPVKPTIRSVAAVGTSLVQQMENFNSSGKVGISSKSWLDWAAMLGQNAFQFTNIFDADTYTGWGSRNFIGLNFGVSGQTSREIWARARQILDHRENYDLIILDIGTNDMGTLSAEEILFLKVMLSEYFAAYGITVVMLTILNRDITSWAAGGDERKKCNFINNCLKIYQTEFRDEIVLHDWNEDWVDQSSEYGIPKTDYSEDGIHFGPAGAISVGFGLWDRTLSKLITAKGSQVITTDDAYDAAINRYGTVSPNPRLRGTAGGTGTNASGDIADGYQLENITGSGAITAAGSKNADGSQNITFTLTAATLVEEFYYRTSPANIAHSFGGDWMIPYAVIKFNNEPDSLYGILIEGIDQSNSVFRSANLDSVDDSGGDEMPMLGLNGKTLYITGRPFQLTDSSTQMRLRIQFIMGNGGSFTGADLDIYELALRRIPQPRFLQPNPDLFIEGA